MNKHTPVFIDYIINFIKNKKDISYILDCTFGTGGHTIPLINLGYNLTCLDWDVNSKKFAQNINTTFYNINFADIYKIPELHNKFDFILLDLGLNFNQIKDSKLGLSYNSNEYLDMRISKEHCVTDAHSFINTSKETELYNVFETLSEDKFSKKIAAHIVKNRPINTTSELVNVIKYIKGKAFYKQGPSQIFQAIRMHVNNELYNLEHFLLNLDIITKRNTYICFITFHSIEDRVVKAFFKKNKKWNMLLKHKASWKDVQKQKSCRSAMLRIYHNT